MSEPKEYAPPLMGARIEIASACSSLFMPGTIINKEREFLADRYAEASHAIAHGYQAIHELGRHQRELRKQLYALMKGKDQEFCGKVYEIIDLLE